METPDGMPTFERDPGESLCSAACDLGLQVIEVICAADREDADTYRFFSMVSFLPRTGDLIKLLDGTPVVVKRVEFITSHDDAGRFVLLPSIHAEMRKTPPRNG